MTRLNNISQADLENLNTYLDGALSPKEKAEFEVKLARSQALQSTLRDYTILRNCLRSLPPKKAPHHFTLTTAEAQQARVNRKIYLAPVFSFASLVSVMLLAIVFTSDWIFKNMSAPASPTTAVVMEAPMAALKTESTEPPADKLAITDAPLLFNWGSGALGGFGMGGGSEKLIGGGAADSMGLYFDSRVINPGVVTEAMPSDMAAGMGTSEEPLGEPEAQLTAPLEEPLPAPLSTTVIPEDYSGAVIWGWQEECEGEILEVYPPVTNDTQPVSDALRNSTETPAEDKAQLTEEPFQTAAWVKYSLAGLALLFGLLAYFFQRRFN